MKIKSILAILVFWTSIVYAAEIQVYAAASLTDALNEIAETYAQTSEDTVVFNFAASSLLARQIQEGAPADLFISADEEKMNSLEAKELILKETRRSLLSNTLVIVTAKDSPLLLSSPKDLVGPSIKNIALAEPQTVPAGIYAKQYLQQLGIWNTLAERVIPTENVRAALSTVEYGNADAGIVYQTDAFISKKVKIAYTVPREEGPKISYPFAVIKNSEHREEALRFLEYLSSSESNRIFEKYGFICLPTTGQ